MAWPSGVVCPQPASESVNLGPEGFLLLRGLRQAAPCVLSAHIQSCKRGHLGQTVHVMCRGPCNPQPAAAQGQQRGALEA